MENDICLSQISTRQRAEQRKRKEYAATPSYLCIAWFNSSKLLEHFELRPQTLALSLRQVLRDKSGGQSHFLGFFHKELHQSLALVLYPIVEYGILERFLQIADLA